MENKLSIIEQIGMGVNHEVMGNTIQDIFEHTNLNWEVEQLPVQTEYGTIPNIVGNYRSDNHQFLGTVNPKKYRVVQNVDAFDFIDELPNFNLEKVGMFDNGKKVFVVGKSNDSFNIIDDDNVDMYFTFIHGHDGKSGIKFIMCPIRMFCTNQLNLMLKKANFKYTIRHTGDVEIKINQVHDAVIKSYTYIDALKDEFQTLINTKFTKTIDEFVFDLIPDSEDDKVRTYNYKQAVRDRIIDLYKYKDDLQNYKNTQFGVLNAVSDFVSHASPRRTRGDSTINNLFIKSIEGNDLIERTRKLLETY